MRITSKGQVTIPQEIRQQFRLVPNTEIEFVVINGMIVLKKLANQQRTTDLIHRMTGKGTIKMSTDEIMNLTRQS